MSIHVIEFWTDYKAPGPDGKPRGVDMVRYAAVGAAQRSVNIEAVHQLSKVVPIQQAPDNPAVVFANERWDAIRPQYEAWKQGEEVELSGTPLAAWPGLSPSQAAGFHAVGIRTVEEVAAMSDAIVKRVPFPGAEKLKDSAAAFLQSFDRERTASEIAAIREENRNLQEQLQELLAAQRASATPKRRGRPPANPDPAEDANAA